VGPLAKTVPVETPTSKEPPISLPSTDDTPGEVVLDNPVWWALTGAQRRFGTVRGGVALFDSAVSPFGGFERPPTAAQWDELADVAGPGADVVVMGNGLGGPPAGWDLVLEGPGVQLVGERAAAPPNAPSEAAATLTPSLLGDDDVADMLALVAEARPGPFRDRTHELGHYVGIRDGGGRLVAMAGERLRLPGYVEISAVATLPSHRRQGLAAMLVRSVAAGIAEEGAVPFLNVAAQNENAIRLYLALGFRIRTELHFRFLRAPGPPVVTS
jgi:ribosomal protein S18 acetylase RimI-like enzyme